MDYQRRTVDDELDEILAELPAVSLEEPRGVGKTATAQQRAGTAFYLDDPAQKAIAEADPGYVLTGDHPVLIDEWQRVPAVWDAVRRAVDREAKPCSFILTGSSNPAAGPSHSGAGRIVQLRMRPMSLRERGPTSPTVSLKAMLTGPCGKIEGTTDVKLPNYVQEQGVPVRRRETLYRWLIAYAAATATTASFEKIRDAAPAGHGASPQKRQRSRTVKYWSACGYSRTLLPGYQPGISCRVSPSRPGTIWPIRGSAGRPLRVTGDSIAPRLCTGSRSTGFPFPAT